MQTYSQLSAGNRLGLRQRGGGFTLVEMLVVMTIIIFLMSALILTVGNVMETAKIAGTQATINKAKALLNDRLEAFNMAWDQKRFEGEIRAKEAALRGMGAADPIAAALAPMLVRKDLERRFFPQVFAEAITIPVPASQRHRNDTWPSAGGLRYEFRIDPSLIALHQSHPNTLNPATESSEVLYWMLTQAQILGSLPTGDAEFLESELADTDGDGRLEIVDAWGQPLRFYRWPTRLIRPTGTTSLNPSAANSSIRLDTASLLLTDFGKHFLGQDPDDPLGQISTTFNKDVTKAQQFERDLHTVNTLHPFLIVSAGADEELGLYEPVIDKTTFGHLACPLSATLADPGNSPLNDNITNRQSAGSRN